jgi:hypothetical protein
MTDTRLTPRWLTDRRRRGLSAAHQLAYIDALVWSVFEETDGLIEPGDLAEIRGMTPEAADALTKAGLWMREGARWRITDFADTQTSRDELRLLADIRRRDREKKARQRAARANTETADQNQCPGDIPGDRPGDARRGTTQEGRTGRTGQEKKATTEQKAREAQTDPAYNGYDPNPEWCRKCGDKPTVVAAGDGAREWDSAELCRGCNDDYSAEAAEWAASESDR